MDASKATTGSVLAGPVPTSADAQGTTAGATVAAIPPGAGAPASPLPRSNARPGVDLAEPGDGPLRAGAPGQRDADRLAGCAGRVAEAVADIRAGRMVIVVDDEARENEGDLIMAAEHVTAEAINFMRRYGSGVICLPMTPEMLERLRLPQMVARNEESMRTAFAVTIDAKGTRTGISAEERARTIRVAVDPRSTPEDLVRPGHVFPLQAQPAGVLRRPGHTEAAVDLARLAGLRPAGVLCEIVNEDGSMARMPELEAFAAAHGLHLITIADLVACRRRRETLVQRVAEAQLPTRHGLWRLVAYEQASGTEPGGGQAGAAEPGGGQAGGTEPTGGQAGGTEPGAGARSQRGAEPGDGQGDGAEGGQGAELRDGRGAGGPGARAGQAGGQATGPGIAPGTGAGMGAGPGATVGPTQVALVMGDVADGRPVLVRMHSECLTGDVFGSLRCDCGEQLDLAMAAVAREGRGVVCYLRQEGRGIGLANKVRAYALQDTGLDTVAANVALGFPPDARDYGMGAGMLADLGVREIRLLTNNPQKGYALAGFGLKIVERVPLQVPAHPENARYLSTKKTKLGHLLI